MTDLVVAATVTRTELSLTPLALEDSAGGYRVVAWGAGAVVWRREVVTSPYLHGEQLVGAVKGGRTLSLDLRVNGTSDAVLQARQQALAAAFEQFSYVLAVTLNGVLHEFRCQPADYAPFASDVALDKYELIAKRQTFRLTIPADPIPIAGGP